MARLSLTPEIVRWTRQQLGMTQLEFGKMLDVEPNTVYRWEVGIHLPVGKKKRTILYRYYLARSYARRSGREVPGTGG